MSPKILNFLEADAEEEAEELLQDLHRRADKIFDYIIGPVKTSETLTPEEAADVERYLYFQRVAFRAGFTSGWDEANVDE